MKSPQRDDKDNVMSAPVASEYRGITMQEF